LTLFTETLPERLNELDSGSSAFRRALVARLRCNEGLEGIAVDWSRGWDAEKPAGPQRVAHEGSSATARWRVLHQEEQA
jgi:hypothetical protein